jgi:hypothetical protein
VKVTGRLGRWRAGTGGLPLFNRTLRTVHPVRWDREKGQADYSEWYKRISLAANHAKGGGVLAVFDGDFTVFPPGSSIPFCAATMARTLSVEATKAGAGRVCSLAVVFACVEYETWLVAGVESLAGRLLSNGRTGLPAGIKFPSGDPESHGKRWLIKNCPGYRETLHQKELTELLDLDVVREKKLRSFRRLENAVAQLTRAAEQGTFISTPR